MLWNHHEKDQWYNGPKLAAVAITELIPCDKEDLSLMPPTITQCISEAIGGAALLL